MGAVTIQQAKKGVKPPKKKKTKFDKYLCFAI
jgi:hypothetical protein